MQKFLRGARVRACVCVYVCVRQGSCLPHTARDDRDSLGSPETAAAAMLFPRPS